MANAASTSNPSFIVNVGEAYPYPSVIAPNFVTVKLSGKNKYNLWETHMLCLLKSHQMHGFIDGQFPRPEGNGKGKVGDLEAWIISDSLVKGWILGSLSEEAARKAVNHLTLHMQNNTDFTAKDLWDELRRSYGPSVREQASETKLTTRLAESEDAKSKDEPIQQETKKEKKDETWYKNYLYQIVLGGRTNLVIKELEEVGLRPWDKLTSNGNTILHVAVGSSTQNHELLKALFDMSPNENTDVVNSDGSTLLHVAAIGGNIEAVKILVTRNLKLLLVRDNKGQTPLALSISNMHFKTSRFLLECMKENEFADLFSGRSGEDLAVLAISCQDFRLAGRIILYHDAILPGSEAVLTALAQNFPHELNSWETRRGFFDELKRTKQPYQATRDRLKEYFGWPCGHQLFITCYIFFVGLCAMKTVFYGILKVLGKTNQKLQ